MTQIYCKYIRKTILKQSNIKSKLQEYITNIPQIIKFFMEIELQSEIQSAIHLSINDLLFIQMIVFVKLNQYLNYYENLIEL